MKTRLATGILVFALISVSEAKGGPEFAKRYESALVVVTETDSYSQRNKNPDFILDEFNKLREAGSLQDISDSVASTLRDTNKRKHWVSAMTFASMLGLTFDRSEIVAAVRDNFTNFFKLDPVNGINGQDWVQLTTTASLLSYYGTDADVQRLDQFIETLRKLDPSSAESLHVSVARRPQILKQRAEAQAEEASANKDRTPQPQPAILPPTSPKLPATNSAVPSAEQSQESIPWAIVVVMIVAALGLLLKQRAK